MGKEAAERVGVRYSIHLAIETGLLDRHMRVEEIETILAAQINREKMHISVCSRRIYISLYL
jgi:hypothetical protein